MNGKRTVLMAGRALRARVRRLFGLLALFALSAPGGCRTAESESDPGPGPAPDASVRGLPNIVLAVYDNTRFDRYSINGNSRNTSPFFDRLAREGLYLTRAIAPATWTFPSHASMFTGYRNHQLKVDFENPSHLVIEPRVRTIAQLLAERGYLTVSYADSPYFGPVNASLTRGMHYFDILFNPLGLPSLAFSNVPDGMLRDRRVVVTRPSAAERLEVLREFRRIGNTPAVFNPPSPDTEIFPPVRPLMDRYLNERYTYLMEILRARADRPFFLFLNLHNGPQHRTTPMENLAWLTEYLRSNGLGTVDPEAFNDLDNGFLKSDYIVAFCDATLEAVYEWITSTPGMDNTVFIALSDHGQAHAEHGETEYYKHAFAMPWEYLVRVPALFYFPESMRDRMPAGRIDRWISLTDLFFTIAEIGDVVADPYVHAVSQLNGASILARIREDRFDEFVVSESYMVVSYDEIKSLLPELAERHRLRDDDHLAGNVYAIYEDRYKLIYGPQCEIIGRREFLELILLFDLQADPEERRNLAREQPDRLERMMNHWRRHRQIEEQIHFETSPALEYDPQTAEALRATGYGARDRDGRE